MASQGNDDNGWNQRLQDLLKVTLKLSDQEVKKYENTSIDEERKEWLQKAIETVLENDDARKLTLLTGMLLGYNVKDQLGESQLTEIANLFEEINFLVECMDVAKDFNNIGGLVHCVSLLKSQYSSLQWRAADLIANCVQNNPPCQATVLENNGMEILLFLLKKSDVHIVHVKVLYALSSLMGNNDAAVILFTKLKGVDMVMKLIFEESGKIRYKAVFLLKKLLVNETESIEFNKTENLINVLDVLKKEHDESHEIIAGILLDATKENKCLLNHLQSQKNELTEFFLKRKLDLTNLDQEKYQDEIIIYDSLVKLLCN